jgi:hypothetical protein
MCVCGPHKRGFGPVKSIVLGAVHSGQMLSDVTPEEMQGNSDLNISPTLTSRQDAGCTGSIPHDDVIQHRQMTRTSNHIHISQRYIISSYVIGNSSAQCEPFYKEGLRLCIPITNYDRGFTQRREPFLSGHNSMPYWRTTRLG